jgi:hypothetical protein
MALSAELLEELRRHGLHRQEKGASRLGSNHQRSAARAPQGIAAGRSASPGEGWSPRMGQTIKGVLGVRGWFAA